MRIPRIIVALACVLPGLLPAGCAMRNATPADGTGRIRVIQFADAVHPRPIETPPMLRAARNETASFAIQINEFAVLAGRKP